MLYIYVLYICIYITHPADDSKTDVESSCRLLNAFGQLGLPRSVVARLGANAMRGVFLWAEKSCGTQ